MSSPDLRARIIQEAMAASNDNEIVSFLAAARAALSIAKEKIGSGSVIAEFSERVAGYVEGIERAEKVINLLLAELADPRRGEQGQEEAAPKVCIPCRQTGAFHCNDPANCGGPWSDPLPSPPRRSAAQESAPSIPSQTDAQAKETVNDAIRRIMAGGGTAFQIEQRLTRYVIERESALRHQPETRQERELLGGHESHGGRSDLEPAASPERPHAATCPHCRHAMAEEFATDLNREKP